MIGIVIVTHGALATELHSALEHVVGTKENIETVCIGADDDMEQWRIDIAEIVKNIDIGNGVVLLTDMFGGTPSNLAIPLLEEGKVEVIAGVNLPMLVKLVAVRGKPLQEAVQDSQEAARKYISVASQVLNSKKET